MEHKSKCTVPKLICRRGPYIQYNDSINTGFPRAALLSPAFGKKRKHQNANDKFSKYLSNETFDNNISKIVNLKIKHVVHIPQGCHL